MMYDTIPWTSFPFKVDLSVNNPTAARNQHTSFIVTHSWTTESDPWCWQSNSGPRRTTSTRQGFKPCPHTHCRWWWSIIYRLVYVLLFFLVCRGHIPTSSTPTVIFSIFLTTFHSTNQTTKIQLVNFLLVSSSTSLIMKGKRTKLLVWNILSLSSIKFFFTLFFYMSLLQQT